MAKKAKNTGLGKAGFFDDAPTDSTEPAAASAKTQKHTNIQVKEEAPPTAQPSSQTAKRTTILLDDDTLDLIDLLKSRFRREGESKTQSELCALGLQLLAKEKGIKT